jgi:MtN3 and saliva related transmembrane protein
VLIQIVSAIALCTTVVGLVPQIYHTYKTKTTKDLSMVMLVNYLIGSSAWVLYGILSCDMIVLCANILCASTAVISIAQKIYYN